MIITPDRSGGGYSASARFNGRSLVAHGISISDAWRQLIELMADLTNKDQL